MTIQHPSVPIAQKEKLSDDLFRMSFRSPVIAAGLKPGNFVHIRVAAEMDPLFRRAMSVHSCDGDIFRIMFRVVGRGTRLLSLMDKGDSVDMLGPLGNTFDPPGSDEIAIMVAGGTGVPPLHFLTNKLLGNDPGIRDRAIFLCGISSERDYPLAESTEKLDIAFRLSSDDGSIGEKGFVTQLLEDELNQRDRVKIRVYSCGPDVMLREVRRICIERRVRCQVSLEGNMPCGIGTCLGCVVRTTRSEDEFDRICMEGPIFNCDEVVI
jgi:dihydroorotate dehydrogenase electron transfer subunit